MAEKKSIWYKITHETSLSSKEYLKLVHRVSIFVVLALVVSLCIFIALALIGGFYRVVGIILSSNLLLYGLAGVAVLLGYLLRFFKWNYYMKWMKLRVPLKKSIAVYFSLYSMEITPGRIGRLLIAYTLNRITKVKVAKIIPIVTIDIFTDFLGVAVLATGAALLFHQYVLYVIIVSILLIIPFLVVLNRWFFDQAKKILKNTRFIKVLTDQGEAYYISQSKLNTPKTYLVSMLFTLPSEFMNGIALYFSLLAVGVKPHLIATQFVYASTQVFGMITGSPGNIGVTDATLVAFIGSIFKLNFALSSAIAIMTRFATLWLMTVIGIIFLIYTLRYWKKHK